MKQIIKSGQRFSRRVYASKDEARAELAAEPYKLELIDDKGAADDAEVMEVGGAELTVYDNLNPRTGERQWCDLCRGPHVPTTKYIAAFKLTRSSAAYWRAIRPTQVCSACTVPPGNRSRPRTSTSIVSPRPRSAITVGSAPNWTCSASPTRSVRACPSSIPRAASSARSSKTIPDCGTRRPDTSSSTPRTPPRVIYSNCPGIWTGTPTACTRRCSSTRNATRRHAAPAGHRLLPQADELPDAQSDLPFPWPLLSRVAAAAVRIRHGLPVREVGRGARTHPGTRLHPGRRPIYCTREQMGEEVRSLLQFVLDLLRDYGLDDFYLELSTRNPDKSIGSDQAWRRPPRCCGRRRRASVWTVDDPGCGVLCTRSRCRPKDAIGRTWQMSTIQVDLMLPDRFELDYTGSDGAKHRPVMIHRALFRSIERFFGVLTEHYAGAFPAWLSPVQVVGIPVAEAFADHLAGVIRAAQGTRRARRGRLLR